MLELTRNDVRLNGVAQTKEEAIQQMVDEMVSSDLVTPEYVKGMQQRELQTSTFLGNGIAIPHGTPETRSDVKQTAVKVIRFPNGLDWGEGQIAHTIIGIAAKSDEHLDILRQLTHVITDDALSEQLHTTPSAENVISILKGEKLEPTLRIDPCAIRMDASVQSLGEACALAGAMLKGEGYILAGEQSRLLAQEPLNFGAGIWLTTDMTDSATPGVAVVSPLKANQTEEFRLLISLTTHGRTHKKLYDRLLQLKRDQQLHQLTVAKTASSLASLLKMTAIEGDSIEIRLPIEHGLHARPAANLSKLIKAMDSDVWVTNLDGDGTPVLGTSVARLINLGAALGHCLRFTVTQSDNSNALLQQISDAVTEGLGDPVVSIPDADDQAITESVQREKPQTLSPGDTVLGLTGAPGMAVGRCRHFKKLKFTFSELAADAADDYLKFDAAIEQLMSNLSEKLNQQTDDTKSKILAMHLELLNDPELVDTTRDLIRQGKSAAWAWSETYQSIADELSLSTDPLLAERADDYKDLGYQLMLILNGQSTEQVSTPHILVCDEIGPSQVAEFDPDIVRAIVTAKGGTTSHAAILARAAGIPLLVGCGEAVLQIEDDAPLIVDCDNRILTLAKDSSELQLAEEEVKTRLEKQADAFAHRFEPAVSKNGTVIEVVANISSANDIEKILEQGAEGVGLFRSEFLYMAHTKEPSHEQQRAQYQKAREALGNKDYPLIVRTLDVGGDKPLPYLAMDEEENPFLGVRGARLSLMRPDMLRRQLSALLDAAQSGAIRIMFPMISDINEWRKIKAIYEDVAAEYPEVTCEIGMMIEVPSAALMADVFAPELDFFSVGTNDLTQYTLAVDRGHAKLSRQADPMHPAILRLIDMTVKAADRHGIWVGVCGELAADPFAAQLLLGLGVKELSMSSKAIPMVKAAIRQVEDETAKRLAKLALTVEDADSVYQLKTQEVNDD